MKDFPIHPAAEIFPAMRPEEFAALKADIEANGQRDPITLHRDKVLDGRNRLRGCRELGVEPRFEEWDGEDPIAFVVSRNLHRRHLDESQRAMVAAHISNLSEGRPKEKETRSIDLVSFSRAEAGALLNVSEPSVGRAKRVIRDGVPELADAVRRGDVKVAAAAPVSSLPAEEQRSLLAEGPKAVRKRAAQLRHAGPNGHKKKKKRRVGKPAPWLDEAAAEDGLAAVESLLKKWQDAGTLRALVKGWEDHTVWHLCDRLEELARTLRGHATELRKFSRGRYQTRQRSRA